MMIDTSWVRQEAAALQEQMVRDRRWLHSHPEVGEHLPGTVGYVESRLEEMGIAYRELCDSGLVVLLGGKHPGKCLIVRADMDALPMREESGLPFASQCDAAHTCGHDLHTAMMLAVCRILKEHEDEIQGTVKAVFQPAEENFRGAAKMLESGLLEDPKVDAAVTLHVNSMSPYPVGALSLMPAGPILASCDTYRIEVEGVGGHGAYPAKCVDPISIGAHILVALQQINARELTRDEPIVLTQGSFHSGKAPNIIPSSAVIEGTLRTFDEDLRQRCLKRVEEIVTSVGEMYRAKATFTVMGGCSPMVNDPGLRSDALRYFREMLGEDMVFEKKEVGMASEDFGNVIKYVPGIQITLVAGSTLDGAKYQQHHPKVVFDEGIMTNGASAFVTFALRWLAEQQ